MSTNISPVARLTAQAIVADTAGRSLVAAKQASTSVPGTLRCARKALQKMLDAWIDCVVKGRKILLVGNGGSASNAQHLATALVVRVRHERCALPAISRTTDSSVLTACGDDMGSEHVRARRVETLGRSGDLAFGLSTSGRSRNVNMALATARVSGLVVTGMTADVGDMVKIARPLIIVPSSTTARVQEMHITFGHLLCERLEQALCERGTIAS